MTELLLVHEGARVRAVRPTRETTAIIVKAEIAFFVVLK